MAKDRPTDGAPASGKGLLEKRVIEKRVWETSPGGRGKKTRFKVTTEYRISEAHVAEVLPGWRSWDRAERDRRRAESRNWASEVPRDVSAMGSVAITIWRTEGRKPSRQEVERIERELAGSYI